MFIILYDHKSGHFTCFQLHVLFVVSQTVWFDMKFAPPSGDFSLENILSAKLEFTEYNESENNSPPQPDHLNK